MTQAWIVIPTYNEAQNLPSLVAAVRAAMTASTSGVAGTILVVDDNAPDSTGRIADRLADAHPDVHVLHRPGRPASAARASPASGARSPPARTTVLEMDADFSHDPFTVTADAA